MKVHLIFELFRQQLYRLFLISRTSVAACSARARLYMFKDDFQHFFRKTFANNGHDNSSFLLFLADLFIIEIDKLPLDLLYPVAFLFISVQNPLGFTPPLTNWENATFFAFFIFYDRISENFIVIVIRIYAIKNRSASILFSSREPMTFV